MKGRPLKSQLAGLSHWTGVDRLVGAMSGIRGLPLVLGYHRVVGEFGAHSSRTIPAMLVSQHMLERHLDWVARQYRLVSLDEIGSHLESGLPTGRLAAVTFDDGYRDVYDSAYPLLKRKGIPAAVFVVTDLVGTSKLQLHDRLYLLLDRAVSHPRGGSWTLSRLLREVDVRLDVPGRLDGDSAPAVSLAFYLLSRLSQDELNRVADRLEVEGPLGSEALADIQPLTWEMLREMQQNGITVGSHTRSHAVLPREDPRDQTDEVTLSRHVLQEKLHTEIRHFAYPAGGFNRVTVDAVKSAGYQLGFTNCRHRDLRHSQLTIPRVLLWERSSVDTAGRFSPAIMSCLANGVLPITSRCAAVHGPLSRTEVVAS
jgi:peptidoglycan/xylan/chitin deacetylase (PgdA/CDA1 family)